MEYKAEKCQIQKKFLIFSLIKRKNKANIKNQNKKLDWNCFLRNVNSGPRSILWSFNPIISFLWNLAGITFQKPPKAYRVWKSIQQHSKRDNTDFYVYYFYFWTISWLLHVTKQYHCSPHILDNLAIFIPFNSFFRGWKHWIRFLCLFEEASFPATFTFHHQIMFGLMHSWLINIFFRITLITGINICPEMIFQE